MNEKKAAAYRMGLLALIGLAVLTAIEFVIAIYTGSLVLLFLIALVKAAVIIVVFMHITRLWQEESH